MIVQRPAAVDPINVDARVGQRQAGGLGQASDLLGGKIRIVVKPDDQRLRRAGRRSQTLFLGAIAELRAEVERMLAGSEEPSWQSPAAN
jgi:hypothetical protein